MCLPLLRQVDQDTFGKVIIDEVNGIGAGAGSGGSVEVVIPPVTGHGADPKVELGGYRIMINTKFTYAEGSGDFPTDNDYRRIGLVINPYKNGTQELTSDLTLSATKTLSSPLHLRATSKLMRLSHNLAHWWSASYCSWTCYFLE